MKDKRLVQQLVAKIGIRVNKELTSSVSSSSKSLFREGNNLCKFKWSTLLIMDDFRRTNHTLCTILEPSFECNKSFPRKPDKNVVLSVIARILFRNCNQHTNLLQCMCPCCYIQIKLPNKLVQGKYC